MPAGLPRRSVAKMGATRPRPPAPIKNRKLIACWFFIGAGGRGLPFKGCGLAENPRKGRLPLDPSLDD